MSFRKSDVTVYVFVLAVLLSGMLVADRFGMDWSPPLLLLVGIAAAVWTAYFRFAVGPRLEMNTPSGESGEPDSAETRPPNSAREGSQRESDVRE